MRRRIWCLLLSVLSSSPLIGEPTESRTWTSIVGSTIEGKAIRMANGIVAFDTTTGRKLEVPLDKLAEEDRSFLREHFRPKPPQITEYPAAELDHPLGEIVGPLEAAEGSSYYIYFPTTMANGADTPLLFFTNSGRAKKGLLERFRKGAEMTGMVAACSIEARNQDNGLAVNLDHTEKCLAHIRENFPVDVERVFFAGNSGGAAVAFNNAANLKCAGALPFVGYIPRDSEPDNTKFYFVCSGAWDFNRYLSAEAARRIGENGLHRMYPSGHNNGPFEIAEEGMIWLYTRHIYETANRFSDEKANFEPRFYARIAELAETAPHLAYFWTDHLLRTCKVTGNLKPVLEALDEELASNPMTRRYLEGRAEIAKLSQELLAPFGRNGSLGDHADPTVVEAAEALALKYQDVEEIKAIAEGLAQRTQDFKRGPKKKK